MKQPPVQETQWVLQAQCGDREALERLLLAVTPRLRRYLSQLGVTDGTDDVLQQVFIAIARKIRWLRRADSFRPWMYRIATRATFKHFASEQRWATLLRDEEALAHAPAIEVIETDHGLLHLLHSADLSPASRAVLILHFENELTLPEVAATLGVPLGTVKSRLAYGLATLRKLLTPMRSIV